MHCSFNNFHKSVFICKSLYASGKTGISHASVMLFSVMETFLDDSGHNFFKSTVDHVLFSQNIINVLLDVILDVVLFQQVSHLILVVGFPSSGHQTHFNVLGVLEPFEVGNSHTTGVGNVIGNNWDVLLVNDLLSLECNWSIGTFTHDLAF